MKQFKIRNLKPVLSDYYLVEAETVEDAVQDFHLDKRYGLATENGAIYSVIEANGVNMLSRIFVAGIGRTGGIKQPKYKTLPEIADALMVDLSLLESNWIGEEQEFKLNADRTFHITKA